MKMENYSADVTPQNTNFDLMKGAVFYNLNIPRQYNYNKHNYHNKPTASTVNRRIYKNQMHMNENYVNKSLGIHNNWQRSPTDRFKDNVRSVSPKSYKSDGGSSSSSRTDSPPLSINKTNIQTYRKYNQNPKKSEPINASENFNNKNRLNCPKESAHHRNTDVIRRRAHGLVERFKSHSDLMYIEPNPVGLLNGGPWDQLNQAIWDVYSSKAQKQTTYECKISLWKHIFLNIRRCLSNYGLYIVGSTMSGFGLDTSDIDMCLITRPVIGDPRLDSLHHLNNVRDLLLNEGLTIKAELIMAKVPILKFCDKKTNFEIDLNCNNSVGIRNTHLLHCYARLDWRVRPLVIMVKLWAQANHINDAKNMTVSSYSWALMVINYLQCGVSPPVLPCLHTLMPGKFNTNPNEPQPNQHSIMDVQENLNCLNKTTNVNCLAELFLGFLQYYSHFDYGHFAISVRTGNRIPILECRFMRAPKNDPNQWKFLCIEEPFDLTNTARSVFDNDTFQQIKIIIISSYNELLKTNLLSNVLPVKMVKS